MFDSSLNSPDSLRRILESEDPSTRNADIDDFAVDGCFLDRALDLAWLGAGSTHPNPLVGAVVVKDGRVLGAGYHKRFGEAHAEVLALDRAGRGAEGSTLYVTLEPCSHHGNTPPCVEHIVKCGVKRVVIPILDPDERVNGSGVQYLRDNGIAVDVGVGQERALLLNMKYLKKKLDLGPSVTLKMAVTLDGRIASRPGARDDMTGVEARRMVHRLRAVHDAVAIGVNTFDIDSPKLDCRLVDDVESPVPVVFDSRLSFPVGHPWLSGRAPVIVAGRDAPVEKEKELTVSGGRVVRCSLDESGVDIAGAIASVFGLGLESVLVEGGAKVFASFVRAGLWDGLYMFVSPSFFGAGGVAVSSESFDKNHLNAELAGMAAVSGDVVLSFINKNTRRSMLERLA